jgi:hypothetical protein
MENTDTVLSAPKVRTRGGQHRLAANGVYLLNLVEGEFCEFPSMKVLLEVSSHWVSIEHIMPCRDGGHRPPIEQESFQMSDAEEIARNERCRSLIDRPNEKEKLIGSQSPGDLRRGQMSGRS